MAGRSGESSCSSMKHESEPKEYPSTYKNSLFFGVELTKFLKPFSFELDYSQYITIVEESYKAVTTCNPDLQTLVPFSAYQYYMVIALWRRLYQMMPPHRGHSTFVAMMEVLPEMPLPKEVRMYLKALGTIWDPEYRNWAWYLSFDPDIFTDQVHGSAYGSFGKVDTKTHIRYETMPAPIVALLVMKEDMSLHPRGPSWEWQLPEDMTPDADGQHVPEYPTANLLGYRPATLLTEDQRTMLHDNGIVVSENGYHFDVINVDRIPIAQRLLTFLAGQFSNAKCAMEVFNSTSDNGSLAQVPFTTLVPQPHAPVCQGGERAVEKLGKTCSHIRMSPHIARAAAVFRFRFKRFHEESNTTCCAYRFSTGEIPSAWTENVDDVFDKETPAHWNKTYFTTGAQNGRSLAAQLAENTHRQHRE